MSDKSMEREQFIWKAFRQFAKEMDNEVDF